MFELFIALFGGLYYAIRIGSEKSAHKQISRENDMRRSNMSEDYDRWVAAMMDKKLEYYFEGELLNNPSPLFETIKFEINNLGIFKPVNNYFEFKSQCTQGWEKLIPLRMLMAKQGKLRGDDAYCTTNSPRPYGYSGQVEWHRHHKFMMWLDKELQSHGVEQMYFIEIAKHHEARYGGGEILANVIEPVWGKYFWRSARLAA